MARRAGCVKHVRARRRRWTSIYSPFDGEVKGQLPQQHNGMVATVKLGSYGIHCLVHSRPLAPFFDAIHGSFMLIGFSFGTDPDVFMGAPRRGQLLRVELT